MLDSLGTNALAYRVRPSVTKKKVFFGLSPQMTVSVTAERNKRIKVFGRKRNKAKKNGKNEFWENIFIIPNLVFARKTGTPFG